jgi:hypothetical protein
MTRRSLTCLSILLFALAAGAQTSVPIEIEAGYRWSNVDGNEDLYRTQIDERSGFVLRAFTFFTPASSGFTDHVRIDATDLGVGPASSLRIETGKADLYKLRLGYRSFDTFSALPNFANPLFAQGITPGQHTFDRNRTMFDADLEFLPGRKISPFVGYSQSSFDGPGTTTYTLGGDEFLLGQNIDEKEREIRAGAVFELGKFYGSVTQGWRNLESDEELTLAQAASNGNNTGTVLGRAITGSAITRNGSYDVDTPFTSAYLTGELGSRVRLTGSFFRFAADSDSVDEEAAAGSFVSFGVQRFFNGFDDSISSRSKNTTWRGSARAEVSLTDRIELLTGFRTEHRELSGDALIRSVFVDSTTFGGLDRRDFEELVAAESALDREVDVIEAALNFRALGPFSLRFGASQSRFDYGIEPDVAEIVVPGNQGSNHERKVSSFDAVASFRKSLFSAGVSWRRDDADEAVLRTEYTSRDRVRVRAGFHTPGNMFRVGLTAEDTQQDNDQTFDADSRMYTADVEVAPVTPLRLRAAYSRLRADSTVTFRRPETFALDTSRHDEDGDALELGLAFDLRPVTIDASASRYENEGTLPFNVDRYRTRIVYDFLAHTGIAAEWSRDNYEEDAPFGAFEADRYGLFFRYRP